MPIEPQSSILLHIMNLSLKFRWIPECHFRPLDPMETRARPLLAISKLVKMLSDLLVPTSGTLSIRPYHMGYPHLHIPAQQCNLRALHRTYVVAVILL